MEDVEALLEELMAQENILQFKTFNSAGALELGLRLVELAGAMGRPIAVDIHANGTLLFQHAMDGCTPDHACWLARKRRVVQRYARSSLYMGRCYRRRGTSFEAHTGLDPHEYAAKGGGFPLRVRACGQIGCITVSGLSEEEDHALVAGVLGAMLGLPPPPAQAGGIAALTRTFWLLAAEAGERRDERRGQRQG
ncbi:MAG: heme-degrading domain-containing protein [Telluria sp.]